MKAIKRDGASPWYIEGTIRKRESFMRIPCNIVPAGAFPSSADSRSTDDIKLIKPTDNPSEWYWAVFFTHPSFLEVLEGESCPMLGKVKKSGQIVWRRE